jgi:SecD/SecF fusion protein
MRKFVTLLVAAVWLAPTTFALSQEVEQEPAPPAAAADAAKSEPEATSPAAKPDEESAKSTSETAPPETAAAPPVDATPEAPATSSAEKSDASAGVATPSADTKPVDPNAAAQPKSETPLESTMPPGKTEPSVATKAVEAVGGAPEKAAESNWFTVGLLLALVALFIVPMWLGNALARLWKMPDHGWKYSLIIGTLAASILICTFGTFKFGPDLRGGITLIYERAESAPAPEGQPATDDPDDRKSAADTVQADLIAALKRRLDPDGTKEITVRGYGPAVEIIIPETGSEELDFVKKLITRLGSLEFRITADPTMPKDRATIELAKLLGPHQKDVMKGNAKVAEWVAYNTTEFGPVDEDRGVVKRLAGQSPEALLLMDPWNVTGDDLATISKGLDDRGRPAVHFSLRGQGARKFQQLTSQNKPNPATPDKYRNLGIILDKRLESAPRIESTISERGMISGGAMTDKEVEQTIEVLKAGSLPAALNKTPISEEIISPTLGKKTVDQGTVAIMVSFVAVMLFMLIYYRFAGVVACIALVFNLLLVLAIMVAVKAAFTLPGLAGLVLTIGMAVDANVLIYERIREELRSGAALRMAIRNGFSRAMTAIIDSNVTTIITGIVLFYLGTDQVKGFAVTLIFGLMTSMFTAIFVSRVIFDVAERRGWIKNLNMMKLMSSPNVDFLGARWPAIIASLVLIGVGMVAVYTRGTQLLNIDFTGGSSVTFSLKSADQTTIAQVDSVLRDSELADKNLLVVGRGESELQTRFTIDTSEQDVDKVKQIIDQKFGDKLLHYSLQFSDVAPVKEGDLAGTEAKLKVNAGDEFAGDEGVSHDSLRDNLQSILAETGHTNTQVILENPNFKPGSSARYQDWTVRLVGVDEPAARDVLQKLQDKLQREPVFPLASTITGRVSNTMQTNALIAVAVSLVSVVIYLWLRFQKVSYGLAAAIAVAHDVLVTIGMMALSYYIVSAIPSVARFLKIDAFQIDLTIVAALLTIIGYSLNDTIVTFDRLREIKGKSPRLTPQMVNASVNQCLSRTILTALTVFLVVVILYLFGGEGIHSFAYAFLVGVIAGTYSTVYIAAPVLLWLTGSFAAPATPTTAEIGRNRRLEPAR